MIDLKPSKGEKFRFIFVIGFEDYCDKVRNISIFQWSSFEYLYGKGISLFLLISFIHPFPLIYTTFQASSEAPRKVDKLIVSRMKIVVSRTE